eukprot:313564_1
MSGTWQVQTADEAVFHTSIAGGVYNDTIYLIGGNGENSKQVTKYQWRKGIFSTEPNKLHTAINGYGQYWTQKDSILYLIVPISITELTENGTANHIATYNLETNEFISNLTQIVEPVSVFGCLASSSLYESVYVVGGWNYGSLNLIQMLNLSTLQWLAAPAMNQPRDSSGCIVHNGYLWAFGGFYNGNLGLHSNERINTTSIMQNKWHNVDPFPNVTAPARCVSWKGVIYIFGSDGNVYLLNASTGVIALSVDHLPYQYIQFAPIISNGILYVFGTYKEGENLRFTDKWIYLNLTSSTTGPTLSPSHDLSKTPSNDPTQTTSLATTHMNTHERSSQGTDDVGIYVYVVIAVIGICIFCIIVRYLCKRIRKKHPAEIQVKETSDTSINTTNNASISQHIQLDTLGSGCNVMGVVATRNHSNHLEVQYWLENVVQIPSYYDILITNGYDSLAIIREIADVTELVEIGIESKEHQNIMLREIEELKVIHGMGGNAKYINRLLSKEGHNKLMMTQEGY